MSSPLMEVKVYSSCLVVASVKLCPWPRLVLGVESETHSVIRQYHWVPIPIPAAGAIGDLGE